MTALANGNVNGNGIATRPPKFQLPALDFKFGSLTEGTNIPPPLPSPIEEEPSPDQPKTAVAAAVAGPKLPTDNNNNNNNNNNATTTKNGTQTTPEAQRNGTKRPADTTGPASPTSSTGPASIRRLFSRNRLNEAYHANGHPTLVEALAPRPTSQSNASIATDRTNKRTSGWFRRLRGSDGLESRRTSRIFFTDNTKPSATAAPIHTGPPPPKIPEFKALGSHVDVSDDGGSLGSDLFKDIK